MVQIKAFTIHFMMLQKDGIRKVNSEGKVENSPPATPVWTGPNKLCTKA